jgi:hypothetical protein
MLIDLKDQRLVKIPLKTAPNYVILSYVWGHASQLQTTTTNLAAHGVPGALRTEQALELIPQVIKDAMVVTEELKERFLWVDSLCICQDDDTFQHEQIQNMGTIYSCALVTLIPLTGMDANATLRIRLRWSEGAILQAPSWQRIITDLKGNDLEQELYSSVYYERGWTFQERLLSTRCIFFGEERIFFACHKSFVQDGDGQYGASLPTSLRLLNPFLLQSTTTDYPAAITAEGLSDQQFEIYINIVEQYSKRRLTYPTDILPAFDGISAVFRDRYGWKMHLGLSQNFFFQSLLWTTSSPRQHTTFYNHDDSKSYRIPSWTWAGWAGPADYGLLPLYSYSYHVKTTPNRHSLHSYLTRISFLHWHGETLRSSQLVDNSPESPDRSVQQSPATPNISGPLALSPDTFYLHFFAKTTPLDSFDCRPRPTTVNLKLTGPAKDKRFSHKVTWLEKDGLCGILYGINVIDMPIEIRGKLDMVWLGEMASAPEIMAWEYPFRKRELKLDSTNGRIPWSQILVMLVAWKGNVAERLAIGYVHKSDLSAVGGVEKEIILA